MSVCMWLAAALLWQGDENVLQRLWRLSEPVRYYINYTWKVGNFPFSIASLILGLAIVVVAVLISRYLRAFVERRMSRHKHLDPGVQFTILRLVHYFIMAFGVILARIRRVDERRARSMVVRRDGR